MARKQLWNQDYHKHIGATILIVLSFLGGLFSSVATPIGMLVPRNNTDACYTLWGLKIECNGKFYDQRIEDVSCPEVRWRLEAAMAFSVIGIFFAFFAMAGACYQLTGERWKTPVAMLVLVAVGSLTVPWAVICSMYFNNYCGNYKYTKQLNKYGPGFPIMIVAWALLIIGFVLFWMLEPNTEEADAIDAAEKEARYGTGAEGEKGEKKKGSDDSSSSSSSSSSSKSKN